MQRRFVSLLLLGVLVLPIALFGCSRSHGGSSFEGPVAEAWVARYSSHDGSHSSDYAHGVAVDTSGNVYITGQSYDGVCNDYITVKYDSSGKELWVARYNGLADNHDMPRAIAVDASGNVYVTGGSTVEGRLGEGPYDYDYATIKYGADGTQLWVARYNGPGDAYDEANAIALDKSGNAYVTGTSNLGGYGAGSGLQEYATIKYDGDGNELWVARYHGPYEGLHCANAIAVDAVGSVFITGYSVGRDYESSVALGGVYDHDYATVKYDTQGHQLWVARYQGPGSAYSAAAALALDSLGNVYVTGTSQGAESNDDYLTVKYSAAGKELWVARHDGPASRRDSARDIAVDAWGNAYVTGFVTSDDEGASHSDYATVKYDTNGNELWVRGYESTADGMALMDEAYAIAVDSSGNAYVTGEGTYGDNERYERDGITIKYDTNGTELWVARYNGPKSGGDSTRAIVLDDNGDVYVAGTSYSGNDRFSCITIKYVPE
jgi:hypothetical protein